MRDPVRGRLAADVWHCGRPAIEVSGDNVDAQADGRVAAYPRRRYRQSRWWSHRFQRERGLSRSEPKLAGSLGRIACACADGLRVRLDPIALRRIVRELIGTVRPTGRSAEVLPTAGSQDGCIEISAVIDGPTGSAGADAQQHRDNRGSARWNRRERSDAGLHGPGRALTGAGRPFTRPGMRGDQRLTTHASADAGGSRNWRSGRVSRAFRAIQQSARRAGRGVSRECARAWRGLRSRGSPGRRVSGCRGRR